MAYFAAAGAEPTTQAEALAVWKRQICHASGARQIAWLNLAAGILAFGSAGSRAKIGKLLTSRRRLENLVCSEPWRASVAAGIPFPTGMVLSIQPTRFMSDGENAVAHCRMTPTIAVALEDRMDRLGGDAPKFPRSPSAVYIERIRDRLAKPEHR
jgi:hypothetical protein